MNLLGLASIIALVAWVTLRMREILTAKAPVLQFAAASLRVEKVVESHTRGPIEFGEFDKNAIISSEGLGSSSLARAA